MQNFDARACAREPVLAPYLVLAPYHEADLDLIPINGKRPIQKRWTDVPPLKFEQAVDRLRSGENVGVRLPEDWIVIDYDPRNDPLASVQPLGSLAELFLSLAIDPSEWPMITTGGGGRHVYLKTNARLKGRSSIPGFGGIEVKSVGNQVVAAGSIHPETGRFYRWDAPLDKDGAPILDDEFEPHVNLLAAANLPKRLEQVLRRQERPLGLQSRACQTESPERIAELLDVLDPEAFRDHDKWFQLMASCHNGSNGDALAEFTEWSTADPAYADQADVIAERWNSLNPDLDDGCTIATLLKHVKDAGRADLLIAQSNPDDDFKEPFESGPFIQPTGSVAKRSIRIKAGDLAGIVDQATIALAEQCGDRIFQSHDRLLRPAKLGNRDLASGTRLGEGATVLLPVAEPWLVKQLSRSANWVRRTNQVDGTPKLIPTDPSQKLARMIMHDQGEWPFLEVSSLVATPTFDVAAGVPITKAGINPETGLLATFSENDFRPLLEGLSQEDARERLEWVHGQLFRSMPFDNEVSRAVAMSAVLTAIVRPTLRAAPMHLFDAAMPGTGKSKLATIVGIIATGIEPGASAWASCEEENEKRLSSLLRLGQPVILFDNIDAARGDIIGGSKLNIVLTQDAAWMRVLGKSEQELLSTRVMLLGTGNNLRVVGDTMRRVVKCRLDAKDPDPERRVFDWDPVQVAKEHRHEIVIKLLEAMVAYHEAGRPGTATAVGSFEEWNFVQGLLTWCGFEDPAKSMWTIKANDADRRSLLKAFETWTFAFENDAVSAADIERFLNDADDVESRFGRELQEGREALREALLDGKTTKNWISKQLASSDGQAMGPFYLEIIRTARSPKFRVLTHSEG